MFTAKPSQRAGEGWLKCGYAIVCYSVTVCAQATRGRGPNHPKESRKAHKPPAGQDSCLDRHNRTARKWRSACHMKMWALIGTSLLVAHSLIPFPGGRGPAPPLSPLSPAAVVDKQRIGFLQALYSSRLSRRSKFPGLSLLGWSWLQNNEDGRSLGMTGIKAKCMLLAHAYHVI